MTSKERWLAVLSRQKPDRVPMDFWATGEAVDKLVRHLRCENRREALDKLHVDDLLWVFPVYVGPRRERLTDMYGCGYVFADYGTGTYAECIFNPLAQYDSVEEIEANYSWPSADWFDYSPLRQAQPDEETHPIIAGGSEPFLTYKNLRGQQQAFLDMVDKPEIVHYCLDKLFGLAHEITRRIYETMPGRVMLSHVAEDMGAQEGLMYSPTHIREFFLPGMKRMIDLAHSAGVKVQHHNDGSIRRIIPELIDIGIDILNPVQWRCRDMDREALKREFGDRVIFHGGVDNQYTLAFGSVEEVRQEVRDNLSILGERGGYILAPCHNIQSVSPPENIVAMYEEGYASGWTS